MRGGPYRELGVAGQRRDVPMQPALTEKNVRCVTVTLDPFNDTAGRFYLSALMMLGAPEPDLCAAPNLFADRQRSHLLLSCNDEAVTSLQHACANFVRNIRCRFKENDFFT